MGEQKLRPRTPEEAIVYWAIVGTWGFWLAGGLYLVGAALGYLLLMLVAARAMGYTRHGPEHIEPPPITVLLWVAGMLAMALALVIAHIDFELGPAVMMKSLIGWLKGWALLAVFPLAGSMLMLRPEIIYRATGILALQTLLLAPFFILTHVVGIPDKLYTSPLQPLLGVGPEFLDVTFYYADPSTGKVRWRFFAPWATAAAFVAGFGLIFALAERAVFWRVIGIVSTIVVCFMAGSRLSIVALPMIVLFVTFASRLTSPAAWLALAALVTVAILCSHDLLLVYGDATEAFNNARADSSRVRAALGNIAVHRWGSEAPIFGHGIVERGGHVVQTMPIGTHHTWWGLLFVKGAVGFAALAIPMAASLLFLVVKAQTDAVARVGLGVMMAIILFSFGDNLEVTAYIIWPALLIHGIALARPLELPYSFGGTAAASAD